MARYAELGGAGSEAICGSTSPVPQLQPVSTRLNSAMDSPVGAGTGHHHVPGHGLAQAVVPARHDVARGKALDVPLPRGRQRLIEVVDGEEECAVPGWRSRRSCTSERPRSTGPGFRWPACPPGRSPLSGPPPGRRRRRSGPCARGGEEAHRAERPSSAGRTSSTASRRPDGGFQPAWARRGQFSRSALPAAHCSARDREDWGGRDHGSAAPLGGRRRLSLRPGLHWKLHRAVRR